MPYKQNIRTNRWFMVMSAVAILVGFTLAILGFVFDNAIMLIGGLIVMGVALLLFISGAVDRKHIPPGPGGYRRQHA